MFRDIDATKSILGRQVISRVSRYGGPHVEKWTNFLKSIPNDTRIKIYATNINRKEVMNV